MINKLIQPTQLHKTSSIKQNHKRTSSNEYEMWKMKYK